MNEEQETEIIQLFTETIVENCRALVYPTLYKCLLYFFTPCVPIADLDQLKEELIAHLTHLLIKGYLARSLFKLFRFSTLKEEDQLALRMLQNKGRTLLDLGVENLFLLNQHLEYLRVEVGIPEEDIAEYFNKPFRQAVEYIRILDSHEKWSPKEKMDCIEKINRALIGEIDDYYAKSEQERERGVLYQNRYKRFRKL